MNKYIILVAILLFVSNSYADGFFSACGNITESLNTLTGNINAYGNETCFNVTANPVELDMQGFTIYNASISATSIAIYINGSNIVIRNGAINNSRYGIYINNTGGTVSIRNITFNSFNTSSSYGIYANNVTSCNFRNLAFNNFTASSTYGIYANNLSVCTFTNLSFTNYNYSNSYGFYGNNLSNTNSSNLTFNLGAGGFFLAGTRSNQNLIANSSAQQVYAGFVSAINTNGTTFYNNSVNNSDIGFSINGNSTNLSRNSVTYSHLGVYLKSGTSLSITSTNLSNNYQNIHADISVFPILTLDGSNAVDGKTLYYDSSCQANLNVNSASNVGVLWLANCNKNITVGNMSFDYQSQPLIFFNHSGSVTIDNVTLNNTAAGVVSDLDYVSDITLFYSTPSTPPPSVSDAQQSLPPSSSVSFAVKNSVIGSPIYTSSGVGLYLSGLGPNVTVNVSNNIIGSHNHGLVISDASSSSIIRNNTFSNSINRSIFGSNITNFVFDLNNLSYDGSITTIPSTVSSRPTTIRFATSSLGGVSSSSSPDSPTYNCNEDGYIYPSSARYGFYLTTIGALNSGITIMNTNVTGMSIAYYLDLIRNSTLSNLTIQGANESIYLLNSVNVTLSNIISSTNPAQTMVWPLCYHYYDLRLYNSTSGIVLDHFSINGTIISSNLSTNYNSSLVFDAENLISTAPTGSWSGESVNITFYSMLSNQSSSGTKNTTIPINFTMYYDPSGLSESSFVAYEWNGSDWIDLSSNSTQNTSADSFNFSLLGVHSTYSFFAQAEATTVPNTENSVKQNPSLSVEVSTSCDNNVITVTSDGDPVAGVKVVLTSVSTSPATYSYMSYYSQNANENYIVSNYPPSENVYSAMASVNVYPASENARYTPKFVEGATTLGTTDSNGEIKFDGCGQTLQAHASKSDYSPDSTTFTEVDCGTCTTIPTNTYECTSNNDCSATEQCSDNQCVPVPCDCGFVSAHQCISYQCCSDSMCGTNEICTEHVCVQEEEPECTVDSDCPDDSTCINGSCKPLVGCGEISNHTFTPYQCGAEQGCPVCSVGNCINHICFVGDVVCESGKVGEQKTCEFTQSQDICPLCDYQLTDPTGKITTGKTGQDGTLNVPLTTAGVYKVALLKDGQVIKVTNLVATPKSPIDDPVKSVLTDLTKFIWIPIVLLLAGIFAYILLGHLAKKHKK